MEYLYYALIAFPLSIIIVFGFKLIHKILTIQNVNSGFIDAIKSENIGEAIAILDDLPSDYPLDGANKYGLKIIHQCILLGNVSLIKKLLDLPKSNKIHVNDIVEETGNSSLHMAATLGKIRIVNVLIEYKADVNMKNREGWTPLHLACMKGRHQVKTALLNAGADETLKTNSGLTPFHLQETEKVHYGSMRNSIQKTKQQ